MACKICIKKCLSTEFAIQIKPFLTGNSDPEGPHGIFEVIDQAYQKAYPLFAKRMAALTKKIAQSEDVDSFYAKYVAMLEEAEIGDMSKEELHGMLMIIALEPIQDLREKLFELKGQPSLQQVHAKMQKWRLGKVLNKATTHSDLSSNRLVKNLGFLVSSIFLTSKIKKEKRIWTGIFFPRNLFFNPRFTL